MATIDIPDRICPHCGGTKWIVWQEKYKGYIRNKKRCAKKAYDNTKKWLDNHPNKPKEYINKLLAHRKEIGYYKTPESRESERLKKRKETDVLSNNYIYRIILISPDMKSMKRSDIPQDLIDLKRKQLLLTRQLRKL